MCKEEEYETYAVAREEQVKLLIEDMGLFQSGFTVGFSAELIGPDIYKTNLVLILMQVICIWYLFNSSLLKCSCPLLLFLPMVSSTCR